MGDIITRIAELKIIPVVALDAVEDALPLCRALDAAGLRIVEITFRTAAAREALAIVTRELPHLTVGAGTVTQVEELEAARNAGARFAVAPGFNPKIVRHAQEMDFPFFPGVCTPSEVESALDANCRVLKFFPAEAIGGVRMLKALNGPYQHLGVQFIPTGGIEASNLREYLTTPGVVAVGGSWMVSPLLIRARKWDAITRITSEAMNVIRSLQNK
jgi:2-dehydro-3-deoxyphosphogluconate aldolase/(4S)-4-hydroxy-2-oxoglutarate aldolase